jgi:hypothetical protein
LAPGERRKIGSSKSQRKRNKRQRAIPSELVTAMKLDSGAQLLTQNQKAVDLTQGLRLQTT